MVVLLNLQIKKTRLKENFETSLVLHYTIPAVPLKIVWINHTSSGSNKPYALTQPARKTLIAYAFRFSARKGLDRFAAVYRDHTTPGSLGNAHEIPLRHSLLYKIDGAIIAMVVDFVNNFFGERWNSILSARRMRK